MSAYQPGDRVLVRGEVIEYIEGVGAKVELFSKTDQYHAWVREDLIEPKGAVVLDLDYIRFESFGLPNVLEVLRSDNRLRPIADQIEAQTKPPRIPEPGLWGVVEAGVAAVPIRRWVHHEEGRWISDMGTVAVWDDLRDPVLIREGVES